jgi:RNA polymerase sigma factor (sigma-70 family)
MRREPQTERVGEAGAEAVPRAVRVLERPGDGGSGERPARLAPTTKGSRGRYDQGRRRVQVTRVVALALVLPTPHERIELDRCATDRLELTRCRDEHARPSRPQQSIHVSGYEEHRIRVCKLVPGEHVVVTPWSMLLTHGCDRSLAVLIDLRQRPPLGSTHDGRVHPHAALDQLGSGLTTKLVVAENGEQRCLTNESRELDRRNSPATTCLLPCLGCMRDVPRPRNAIDAREADPLHVSNDGNVHIRTLTDRAPSALIGMMHAMTIPPFEQFYEETRGDVLRLLRRRLGVQRAEDAFQETFLRALRAYGRLENAEHLRAWVLTIAGNVAIDTARRERPTDDLREEGQEDARPPYEELSELTDGLSRKERAAVVLRYGYDLTYDEIAAAMGSSQDAARQAASSGVRRLRARTTT